MLVFIGALLGGIILILRELFPFLQAQKTGVIRTRGHTRKQVLRAEEPDRFKALCRNRTDGMVVGAMVIGFGVAWALVGLFALILILPIGAVMTAMSKRSTKKARVVSEEFS